MAEDVSPEEAKRLGLSLVEDVSPEQAKAVGLSSSTAPKSALEQIVDFIQSHQDSTLRTNPATTGIYNTVQAFRHPEEIAPRMRALLSGATLGYAPKLLSKLEGSDEEANRAQYAKAGEDYPMERAAGGMAVPLPGAGAKGVLGSLARATVAAGEQAVTGYNLAPKGHEAQDAGESALGAAGVSLGLEGAGALAKPLFDAAGKSFLRAIGPRAGIENFLDRQGIDASRSAEIGHELNQEGLVPVLGSKEEALKRALARKRELGGQYESLDKRFDEAVRNSRPSTEPGATIGARPGNADATALMPDASTYNFRKTSAAALPKDLSTSADRVAGMAKRFSKDIGAETGGLGAARENISDASRSADFRFKPPLSAQLYREALQRARGDMSSQIREVLGPEEQAAAKALDRRYALASTAENFSRPAAQREALHQVASPTHILLGGELGGLKGAALAALTNTAMSRINALAGHTMLSASRAASSAPGLAPAAKTFTDWLDAKEKEAQERLP